jgi:hypothetical protein
MQLPGSFRQDFAACIEQLARLQRQIAQILRAISSERGCFNLSIHLGCVTLTGPTPEDLGREIPLRLFLKSMNEGLRVKNAVREWTYSFKAGQKVLSQLMAANRMLEPVSTGDGFYGFKPESLQETRPTLRGTWLLHDPDSPVPRICYPSLRGQVLDQAVFHLIVVQIDWTEDDDRTYDKMPSKFFRLKPGQHVIPDLLNANLFELGNAQAWHFSLEQLVPVQKKMLSRVVTNFADNVQVNPGYRSDSDAHKSFVSWPDTPSTKIYTGRLDRIYTFGMRNTEYVVDCQAMWYPNSEPCWGIVVRHRDWAKLLEPLSNLRPGYSEDFGADPANLFFPRDGQAAESMSGLESQMMSLDMKNSKSKQPNRQEGPIQQPPEPERKQYKSGVEFLVSRLMQLSDVINSGNRQNPLHNFNLLD